MTNAEARFNKSLRPRKPEGSLGRTAQDVHLDSHTAPELCCMQTYDSTFISPLFLVYCLVYLFCFVLLLLFVLSLLVFFVFSFLVSFCFRLFWGRFCFLVSFCLVTFFLAFFLCFLPGVFFCVCFVVVFFFGGGGGGICLSFSFFQPQLHEVLYCLFSALEFVFVDFFFPFLFVLLVGCLFSSFFSFLFTIFINFGVFFLRFVGFLFLSLSCVWGLFFFFGGGLVFLFFCFVF